MIPWGTTQRWTRFLSLPCLGSCIDREIARSLSCSLFLHVSEEVPDLSVPEGISQQTSRGFVQEETSSIPIVSCPSEPGRTSSSATVPSCCDTKLVRSRL